MRIRITIISLAVFVACFGLPGCTNAGSLPSNRPDGFLLVLSEKEFFDVRYPTQDENKTKIGEEDFTNTFQTDYSYNDMTFSCANNSIYLLKSVVISDSIATNYTLDVINFDENNKLKTVTHVKDIFDGAQSITSDWTTGKIYWTVSSNKQFSIKVIDESFEKLEYIIQPNNKTYMGKLRVYPKQDELFFLSDDKLWYTSNSLNSNASLLFESGKEFSYIYDFTIDYATDKLYIFESSAGYSILKSIDIGASVRPLNVHNINEIETYSHFAIDLVAFDDKIYFILYEDNILYSYIEKLYFKNAREKTVDITNLSVNSKSSFVSSSCP